MVQVSIALLAEHATFGDHREIETFGDTGVEFDGTVHLLQLYDRRAKATVPGCPDWSRPSEPNFNSHNASNYGCAINGNLAAMVADPQDLILGRGGDRASDASTSGKAIKTYRDRKPTGEQGLKSESSKGGN